MAIAALAVLGAAHVGAAEAGDAADAETCSAKHVCMDSKLVALLRKHELEAAIAAYRAAIEIDQVTTGQQQVFRQRGLARVRVRDDGEGATARNFI